MWLRVVSVVNSTNFTVESSTTAVSLSLFPLSSSKSGFHLNLFTVVSALYLSEGVSSDSGFVSVVPFTTLSLTGPFHIFLLIQLSRGF